jgi:hypothetical protein
LAQSCVDFIGLAALGDGADRMEQCHQFFRVERCLPTAIQPRGGGKACIVQPMLIDADSLATGGEGQDHTWQRIQDSAQLAFRTHVFNVTHGKRPSPNRRQDDAVFTSASDHGVF